LKGDDIEELKYLTTTLSQQRREIVYLRQTMTDVNTRQEKEIKQS